MQNSISDRLVMVSERLEHIVSSGFLGNARQRIARQKQKSIRIARHATFSAANRETRHKFPPHHARQRIARQRQNLKCIARRLACLAF